jgi:DNA polymerase-3 subunit alpha
MMVAGQIVAVRRRGENQAFVRIDDGNAALELAFFSEAYNEFSRLLTADTLLLAEGAASFDDYSGGYQLRVKSAYPLEEGLARHLSGLRISADRAAGAELADGVKNLLQPARGGMTQVRLHIQRSAGQVELVFGEAWQVHGSIALSEAIGKLPGVRAVDLIYRKRAAP